MTAVDEVLARARAEGRAALVGYLPVGCPSVEDSIAAMVAIVESGVDIVEVGMPYTDPLMDGPVIQDAATRAQAAGVRVKDVFAAVEAVTAAGAAAVVMIYWNLVLRYGVDAFARDLKAAGGSGLITPDLVPDEAQEWLEASQKYGLNRVFLVAPSSTADRLQYVADRSSGFIYATAVMGVTGARESLGSQAQELVARVRPCTDLPVCVGVGVSNPEQAQQVAAFADGVIVGTALVRTQLDHETREARLDAIRSLARELADGVRRGRA